MIHTAHEAAFGSNFELSPRLTRVSWIAGQPSEGTAETNPKRRACEPEFGNGTETMFADGYPYLLTTEVSSSETKVSCEPQGYTISDSGLPRKELVMTLFSNTIVRGPTHLVLRFCVLLHQGGIDLFRALQASKLRMVRQS